MLSAIPDVSLMAELIIFITGMLSNITLKREGGGSDASDVLMQLLKLAMEAAAIIKIKYFFKRNHLNMYLH